MRSIVVVLHTTTYAPNNLITLICQDSLTGSSLSGEYREGAWYFVLKVRSDKERVRISFRLSQEISMKEDPFEIDVTKDLYHFYEGPVTFSVSDDKKRHIHHIDCIVTEDNDFQRRFIPSNLDENIEYDAIVIGSGMGGGILADQLSDNELNVLVLEGGSVYLPQNIVNMPLPNMVRPAISYQNEPDSDLRRDICLNFGGRSVYWSALIPRMNSWEMQQYWPRDVQDYLNTKGRGYDKAEKEIFRKRTEFTEYETYLRGELIKELPAYDVDHLPRSFHTPPSGLSDPEGSLDEVPTGTFSTAALLLNSLSYPGLTAGSKNLTINLNHLVTHIKVDGRRATRVVCQDLINNCERTYKAKYIILAVGATESPCIAIRSGLKDKSGKIGFGLTGHLRAELAFPIPQTAGISSKHRAKLLLRSKHISIGEEQFSCELSLNPDPWNVRFEDEDLLKEELSGDQPIGKIKFMFAHELDDKNRIQPDAKGKHRVYVKLLKDRPFEAQVNGLKNEILRYFGVADECLKHLEYQEWTESYHVGGSLRMGENSATSVVNQDLRFHEYDNLYCCDLSVFPYIPVANPSLTLGALALRLADHIACRSQSSPS